MQSDGSWCKYPSSGAINQDYTLESIVFAGFSIYKSFAAINQTFDNISPTIYGKTAPKPSPNFKTPKYEPQAPPQNVKPGYELYIGKPTEQYPNGYWKIEKPMLQGGKQGVDPFSYKPAPRWEYHVPLPKGYLK